MKTLSAFASAVLFMVCLVCAAAGEVSPGQGGEGIQQALDQAGVGGEVALEKGTYLVKQPIYLRQDGQTLRGAGPKTILRLADNANCPVLIIGAPKGKTAGLRHGLRLSNLLVDGNRAHQQKEEWRSAVDGSWMNNNDIMVWHVEDTTIEHVICRGGRSGGLVTTGKTRRLTVRDYAAFDNQFDGLACYETRDSHFTQLNLHDNPAAGISLDLNFVHNTIDSAVLADNDLGVFMRQSRDNVFNGMVIRHCRHDGVFMAQTGGWTELGWKMVPGTECAGNSFNELRVENCGGRAFRVNNDSCTNNSINGGEFLNNAGGGLSQPISSPVVVRGLAIRVGNLDP